MHKEACLKAAHALYASHYSSAIEEIGGDWPAGTKLVSVTPELRDEVQLPIIYRLVGTLEGAWGIHDVGMLFHHMGLLTVDEQYDALYATLMGCMGHGITIKDDYEAEFDKAAQIVAGKPLAAVPFHFEGSEWQELAKGNAAECKTRRLWPFKAIWYAVPPHGSLDGG